MATGRHDPRRIDPDDLDRDAPGADHDASGAAVVLELFRVRARRRQRADLGFAVTVIEEKRARNSPCVPIQGIKNNRWWQQERHIVGTGDEEPSTELDTNIVCVFISLPCPNASSASMNFNFGRKVNWSDSLSHSLGRHICEICLELA